MTSETSEAESSVDLWGEVQETSDRSDDSDLWRPIKDYENINVQPEGNINEHTLDSNDSVLAYEDEEYLNYDPVGSHIIELRKYYLYLSQQLKLRAKQKAKKSEKTGETKIKKQYFAFPEFPENYPFSESLGMPIQHQQTVNNGVPIPNHLVEKKRVIFIKKVLEQTGVFGVEDETMILKYLSAILDDFLQKFVRRLSHNKNSKHFSKDEDLWNALETTLRNFGIDGICALHAFYYERVAKKHDILFRKCIDMYDELQKI